MLVCPKCSRTYAAHVRQCPADGATLELTGDGDDPMIGVVIDGRYQIVERVGAGGMGTVYRATQLNVRRDVAVKVVNAVALQNPETVRRFENEAHIISQLRHPNTLKLIDFGELADSRPYLVTEFLTGVSLEAVLRESRRTPEWTLRVIRQVCDSLAEAHEKGIIHRDLKPENIFIEEVGGEAIVRVLDFGIAKLGQGSQTATGTVFGTPAYMSPEQAQGKSADGRSDLYSLGIIAYKCIAGITPFVSDEPLALLLMHVNEPPTPLSRAARGQELSASIERFIMSLIEKDPLLRPKGASDVRLYIDHLLNQTPSPSGRIAVPTPPPFSAQVSGPSTREISEPVAAHFVAESDDTSLGSKRSMRFVGVLFLSLALAIAAGAFFAQQPEDNAAVVEQIIEDPPPIPLSAPEAAPAAIEPAAAPEPEVVEPVKKRRRSTKKRRTKTDGAAKKKTSSSSKKKKKKKDEADPPPGFLDFDVQQ